jgi:hypothetical protein
MNRLRLSSSLCTAAIAVLLLAGCEEDCSDDPLAPSCDADYEPTAALD